ASASSTTMGGASCAWPSRPAGAPGPSSPWPTTTTCCCAACSATTRTSRSSSTACCRRPPPPAGNLSQWVLNGRRRPCPEALVRGPKDHHHGREPEPVRRPAPPALPPLARPVPRPLVQRLAGRPRRPAAALPAPPLLRPVRPV